MRAESDESYVITMCDQILGCTALRGHRFPFLVGDSGRKLPVDAYYPELSIVVEYRERQHFESVKFFDHKLTVSGTSRGLQRARYDQFRRDVMPKHGISLVEIDYSMFPHDSRKRLLRTAGDVAIVQRVLMVNPLLNNLVKRIGIAFGEPAIRPARAVEPSPRQLRAAPSSQRGR